jgi:hypothetical protein
VKNGTAIILRALAQVMLVKSPQSTKNPERDKNYAQGMLVIPPPRPPRIQKGMKKYIIETRHSVDAH